MSTYDQVLKMARRLNLPEQLRLLENLTQIVRQQVEEPEKHSIMELEGLGAEVWQNIDVQAYIDQERSSWEP
jgi:hypothetical protein